MEFIRTDNRLLFSETCALFHLVVFFRNLQFSLQSPQQVSVAWAHGFVVIKARDGVIDQSVDSMAAPKNFES